MQLVRKCLRSATCALLAAAAGTASAEGGDWNIDAGMLSYSESGRIYVAEPLLSMKRNFADDRSLSAKVVLDGITGASPTGAMPVANPHTYTTASGRVQTDLGGDMPTKKFHDARASLDLGYAQPLTRLLKGEISGHYSVESDYISRGTTLTLDMDTPDRLTTFSGGIGINNDLVNPTHGGKPLGFAWDTVTTRYGNDSKHVLDGTIGVTRILSRSWLVSLTAGQTRELGYLTEPYKIISVIDAAGNTTGYRFENRPDFRYRHSFTANSTYHFEEDVVYYSYRYYWDDWGIKSHTIDLKYRYELDDGQYLLPHIRYYTQTAVDFYTYGLMDGAPLPEYATSDYRFGKMSTTTVGLKYGFPLYDGECNVRIEYVRQDGDAHPSQAVGIQKTLNLFVPINTTIIQVGYSIDL